MYRTSYILRASTLIVASVALTVKSIRTPNPRQSSGISWSACPDSSTTQCAFFDVPRDYSNPTEGDTVSIFMRKLPASVSRENRLGTILANPGGPGGSGTDLIVSRGADISFLVEGRYDIIGIDPRGVNLTGPWTACFDTESKPLLLEYQSDILGVPYPPSTLDSDRRLVSKISAIQKAHNAACIKNGNRKMLESVGTVAVVQDIARISEALGEGGINYLGWSYGTIIGATLAAMYPDLINRMVLDGVSNAESYFNDVWQWGRDGMADTHKTMSGLLSTCIEAGPKQCAFAAPPKSSSVTQTVSSLQKRLDAIFSKLDKQPVVLGDSPVVPSPGMLTAPNLQKLIFNALYSPSSWAGTMQVLAQVEQGNGAAAFDEVYQAYTDLTPRPYDQNVFNRSMQTLGTKESLRPILCGDAAATNISVDAYTNYFRQLGQLSPIGEQWASIVGGCNGWSFRANHRYTGPWTVAKGLKKTKFPILFMSLDADPVTPLPSAIKMSRGFGNESATLLVQQGFGHCTIAHPSLCTYGHVHDYLIGGKVPANGTRCTPEPGYIYPGTNGTKVKRETLSKRDVEALGALERLKDFVTKINLGMPDML